MALCLSFQYVSQKLAKRDDLHASLPKKGMFKVIISIANEWSRKWVMDSTFLSEKLHVTGISLIKLD